MKKEDLKVGYLVELRNGDLMLLMETVKQKELVNPEVGWINFNFEYNEDLTCSDNYHIDIMKVYGYSKFPLATLSCSIEERELLWKRKEQVHNFKVGDWVKMVEKAKGYIDAELDKVYQITDESNEGYEIDNDYQSFDKYSYHLGKWVKVDELYFDARKSKHFDNLLSDEIYLKCHGLTKEEALHIGMWDDHMFVEEKPEPLKIIDGRVY